MRVLISVCVALLLCAAGALSSAGHPLDSDDGYDVQNPVLIKTESTAEIDALQNKVDQQEKLAQAAISEAEKFLSSDEEISDNAESNHETTPANEEEENGDAAQVALETDLPLNRLKHLKRWNRFSKRDWRRLARRWNRLDPYTQRVLAKKFKKALGNKSYRKFARRFSRVLRKNKKIAARSLIRMSRKRAVGFKNGKMVLRKRFKSFRNRFSRFSRKKGATFRPMWPRSLRSRRVRGWNLVATKHYIDSTCHAKTGIFSLRLDGRVRRYIGGDRLKTLRKAPGGLIQIASSCDGQLWGLNKFGRVLKYAGKRLGWERTSARGTPKFVKLEVGNDDQAFALTRRGKLFRLGSSGRWSRMGRGRKGITLRDLAVTCDGQVVGVNRHWRVAVVRRGKLFKLAQSPRVKQVAASRRRFGIYAVAHDRSVFRFIQGRWGRVPKLQLDQVGLSRSGEVCGTFGRNFYINWAGKRPPTQSDYRRMIGITKHNLTPEGRDPSSLMRHPFSLGKFRPHIDAPSSWASATPDGKDTSSRYVRDNLPLSTLDFKSTAPALPGQFQTYSYRHDPQNDAVKDPLPDTKQEVTMRVRGSRIQRRASKADRQNSEKIMKGNVNFSASATPGRF
eukprot:comp21287_c3_seq1/m.45608 comp21287_c3_seq1/g.45608  ORF comp21287_c3_seq1/g.45608 comp21287_c3_seq1/m.45608 type:complete len:619 (+) comp21287_c3_seq1:56-1912(+)